MTVSDSASVPPKKKGLARLMAAARNSGQGLWFCFRSEEAFRLEVCLALVLAPAALLLGNSAVEKVLLLLAIALVLLTQMLNSAVEAVVDRVGPEYHELSKQAKDMGSAAVFISLATFVAIWGLLLL